MKVRIRDWDDMVKEYGSRFYYQPGTQIQGDICHINTPGIIFLDTMRKYCGLVLDVELYDEPVVIFIHDGYQFTTDMCVPLSVLRDEKLKILLT